MVEQLPLKQRVVGSSPTRVTTTQASPLGRCFGITQCRRASHDILVIMFEFDIQGLHSIQSLSTPWLTALMRLMSWMFTPEIVLPVIAIIFFVLLVKHKRGQEVLLLLILAGNFLTPALKWVVHRERPTPSQAVVLDVQGNYSWPSGHAMAAMTIGGAVVLLAHHRRIASRRMIVAVSFVVMLVGVSRVYLGAHWPSDVIGGYVIGWLWLTLIWRVLRPLGERRWSAWLRR